MRKNIIFLLLLATISSCLEKRDSDFDYSLVVDGWIERDQVAMVILTQSSPLISPFDSSDIRDLVITWAKVTVSDGENSEVLVGTRDTSYYSQFIYKGRIILGEVGKKYSLKVEYSGKTWTSVTEIPQLVLPDSFDVATVGGKDSLYTITATFTDPFVEKNYYKLFYKREHRDSLFKKSFLGDIDDSFFDSSIEHVVVNKNLSLGNLNQIEWEPSFNKKDTVTVKFCTQTEAGYLFWSSFDNELLNGRNPVFPSTFNLPTNISSGGKGIWCGYNWSNHTISYK